MACIPYISLSLIILQDYVKKYTIILWSTFFLTKLWKIFSAWNFPYNTHMNYKPRHCSMNWCSIYIYIYSNLSLSTNTLTNTLIYSLFKDQRYILLNKKMAKLKKKKGVTPPPPFFQDSLLSRNLSCPHLLSGKEKYWMSLLINFYINSTLKVS